MSPKDKAKELASKFAQLDYGFNDKIEISVMHKRQALLAVDEIMYNNLMEYPQHNMIYNPHKNDYWNEVKTEIKKL